MARNLNVRITQLQKKRQEIEAQLAALEKEQRHAQRQQRHKMYTALGRALLAHLEAGKTVPALSSYDDL